MYLFNEDIGSWDDWGRVFQSIAVFEPLVGAIMKEEKLAFDRIYNLTPGTNAVLSSGGRTDRLVPVSPDLGAGHALYQQAGSKGAAADLFLDQASCFEAGLEGGLLDLEKI